MTYKEMTDSIVSALGLEDGPLAVYYTDKKPEGAYEWGGNGNHFCVISGLRTASNGTPFAVNGENTGCNGSAFFLGWDSSMRPGFAEFLSRDAQGKGERYKKTPDIAQAFIDNRQFVPANGKYCIFQRLNDVPAHITPEVVIFFADGDGISGLVWLANYRRKDQAVIAPFSAGCGSVVSEPRAQALASDPKAVLGMFDPSARDKVDKKRTSFAIPWKVFVEMVEDIPGSFVEIEPWITLRDRK